ncbi:ABC transporter permease [Streptomyces sp. ACA25]|uniref:FtsX-like permease family protein n=1 Tax=Streptomyces sp. ACA25 TaxID=3022596 RepID=UPI00230736E0|nr:FtsX-like permease family protein [Streptomyces sp. ACA25]MDB1086928.1 ABC transporter permease [Streptomyces sp. ACA25]
MTGPALAPGRAPAAPAPPEPPGPPAGFRRWAADLALGLRFALAGGREGWTRTVLTGVGVGIGVAVLLLAAAVPSLLGARVDREAARGSGWSGELMEPGPGTMLYAKTDTTFRDRAVRGRELEPDGDRPPLPPGVAEIPGPGQMVVSPALREVLESDDGALLRARLPHEVTGTIGDAGLVSPTELVYYAGSDTLHTVQPSWELHRIDSFGEAPASRPLDAFLLLLVVVTCVVLLLPVGAFIATAVRLGGERRDRRLAALRLVGADIRMTHRMAAGEALAGALLGLLLGILIFFVGRRMLAGVEVLGLSVFPTDAVPHPLITVLILCAVPSAAVVVTLQAMRRISIEPLGVVRGAGVRTRRLWWRLLPAAVGLALLLPMSGAVGVGGESLAVEQAAVGIVLLLVGVTTVLPWLVETVVGRLRGGPLPWQLAVRRLQLDSGPAARAVSGITVAVAGAIAAQMLFSPASGEYSQGTGYDTGRGEYLVETERPGGPDTGELQDALNAVEGVERTLPWRERTAMHGLGALPGEPVFYLSLTVADCAALSALADLHDCADGDVFLASGESLPLDPAGEEFDLAWTDSEEGPEVPASGRVTWTVPTDARTVPSFVSPMGYEVHGVYATPGALGTGLPDDGRTSVLVRGGSGDPDIVEHLRNTVHGFGPLVKVYQLKSTSVDRQYASIERSLHVGAMAVLLLIGAGMLVALLEQLRERRRLLSVLVAFGTPRAVLVRSVLWQTAIPVLLGMTMAVAGGLVLGAVLLSMVSQPFTANWSAVALLAGLGGAVIMLTTLLGMPALWRMMRADGLRSE